MSKSVDLGPDKRSAIVNLRFWLASKLIGKMSFMKNMTIEFDNSKIICAQPAEFSCNDFVSARFITIDGYPEQE